MKISKCIKMFGVTITTELVDTLVQDEGFVGEAVIKRNIIKLQKNNAGIQKNRDDIERVFCHEIVHHMLHQLHKFELRDDENFVDVFSRLLHQVLCSIEKEEEIDTI